MKKLNKLHLMELERQKLSSKQMKDVVGGNVCNCGCCYKNSGGSSDADNADANIDGNLYSYNC